MLGKLLASEWKASARILLPLHLLLIVITIFGKIMLSFGLIANDSTGIISILLLTVYIVAIIAIALLTTICIVVRFYKNLYTDEGYLTFTLPASPIQIFNSKLIIGYLWMLINTILTSLSISLLVINNNVLDLISKYYGTIVKFIKSSLNVSPRYLVFLIILAILVTILYELMTFYVSISIGQLFNKHKIIASVGAYIITYIILQIISFIIATIFDGSSYTSIVINIKAILWPSIILALVISIIFYIISVFIMKKHLNLD